MAWFNTWGMGAGDPDIAVKGNDGKIYKIVQGISIAAIIIAVALLIFEVFKVLPADVVGFTGNGIIISVGMLGVGGMNVLPWVRIFERIEDKRFKIVAIVFMAIIGVVVILWLICVWQVIALLNSVTAGADSLDSDEITKMIVNSINTIRVALIVSLQFMIASGVATNIVKYRKSLIVYQALNGVGLLYIDFYFSLFLTAIGIAYDPVELVTFSLSSTAEWLISPALGALFFIALVLLVVTGVVFARTDRRRLIATANGAYEGDRNDQKTDKKSEPSTDTEVESVEEKFKKIQSLYDNGMITKEEFEQKRADILKDL